MALQAMAPIESGDWKTAPEMSGSSRSTTCHITNPMTTAFSSIWPNDSSDFIEKTFLMPCAGSSESSLGLTAFMRDLRSRCASRP